VRKDSRESLDGQTFCLPKHNRRTSDTHALIYTIKEHSMISTRSISHLVAIAVIAFAGSANAASNLTTLINNQAVAPLIDQSNGFISAYDLGDAVTNINGATPGETTVQQGITMWAVETTGNHVNAGAGTLDITAYTSDATGINLTSTTTGPHFGSTSGTLAPDTLYGDFIFSNATDQAMNISGLDSGKSYLIQFGAGDARTQSFLDFDMSIVLDGNDTGQDMQWNTADDGTSDIYAYAAVTVAGQTSVNIDMISNNSIGPGFSFVTISELEVIPAPAALPAGLALMALVGLRRRKA